jgi:hypothetical protein
VDRSAVEYAALHAEGAEGALLGGEFEIIGAPATDVLGAERQATFGPAVPVVFQGGWPATESEPEWGPAWPGLRETVGAVMRPGSAQGAEGAVPSRRGAPGYVWLTGYGLEQELAETKNRADTLERELLLRERERQIAAADAVLSTLGLFIARKIGESDGGVLIDEVVANLDGAEGWLAIARLMKAGLVDENGRSFYLSPEGEHLVKEIQGRQT